MERDKKVNIGAYHKENKGDFYLFSYSFSDSYQNQKILLQQSLNYTPVNLSHDEMLVRHEAILFLYQKYLKEVSIFFNEYHKTDLSLEYWHYRVSPWLTRQVSCLVDRSMKLEKFFLAQKNCFVTINNFNPYPNLNFVLQNTQLYYCPYNYYISSYLLSKLEIPGVTLRQVVGSPPDLRPSLESKRVFEFLKFSPNGFSDFENKILRLFFYRGLKAKRKPFSINFRSNLLANKLDEKLDLTSFLKGIFPIEFYDEPFDSSVLGHKFTTAFFLKNLGGGSDVQNKQIATWVEKNPYEVIIHQHGSSYGDHLFSARNYICEYLKNTFISWGWENHLYHPVNKIISLPSPIMAKARWRRIFSRRDNSVILISSIIAVNDSNSSTSTHPDQVRDYYNLINKFVELSEKSNYAENFYFRPRLTHNEFSFQISKLIIENFPSVKLHNDKYFERAISKVKLAIVDNHGSVLNKVLAANIPTILIWPKDCNYYREDLDEVFQVFEKEGVLFYDASKAVAHIENINNDINAWWFKPEIQKARQKFVDTLCPVDHFYFFKWAYRLLTWR